MKLQLSSHISPKQVTGFQPAALTTTTNFSPTKLDEFTRSEQTLGLGKDIARLFGGGVGATAGTVAGALAGSGTSWTGLGGAAAGLVIGGVVGGLIGGALYGGNGDFL